MKKKQWLIGILVGVIWAGVQVGLLIAGAFILPPLWKNSVFDLMFLTVMLIEVIPSGLILIASVPVLVRLDIEREFGKYG